MSTAYNGYTNQQEVANMCSSFATANGYTSFTIKYWAPGSYSCGIGISPGSSEPCTVENQAYYTQV